MTSQEQFSVRDVDLIIALGIIKNRNNALWDKITNVHRSQAAGEVNFASESSTGEEILLAASDLSIYHSQKKNIFSIVDPTLNRITLNGLFTQLQPVYLFLCHYCFDITSLKQNQCLVKSLGSDLMENEITRWLLPTYKQLKWLAAIKNEDTQRDMSTAKLINCFQLLLISYYSFHAEEKRLVHITTENFLFKFIKNELLNFNDGKKRFLKTLRDYKKEPDIDDSRISFPKICQKHWQTIYMILNLKIQSGQFSVSFKIIYFLLHVLESLMICFIQVRKLRPKILSTTNVPAYLKFYTMRSKQFNYRVVTEFLKTTQNVGNHEFLKRVYIAMEKLLDVFSNIQWTDDILKHMKHNQEILAKFRNYRIYIQSCVLITGNLDIIAKFRKNAMATDREKMILIHP